jgi:hypothetical protein
MAEYRVYRLDSLSRTTSTEAMEAQTDEEAVSRVRLDMGRSLRCEIWRGNRIVKRLEASPSSRGEPQSSLQRRSQT